MADYRNDDIDDFDDTDPEEAAAGLAGDDFDDFDPDFDPEEAERESARAFAEEGIPSRGLLSSYDRLRGRIIVSLEKRLDKRGGRITEGAVRALLMVPDVFILLVRLTLDKNVPGSTRAMIGGALAYFVLPADLLPEMLLGGAGYLDDLVLAAAVLSQAFGGDLEPYARKHWSGAEDLRIVLKDVSETAQSLLGEKLYDRLKRVMGRRGIEVDDQPVHQSGRSVRSQEYDD